MTVLQTVKKVYRAFPPWMTIAFRYVPNGIIFGKGYRSCIPDSNVASIPRNIKTALDYARMHTSWGKENIPCEVSSSEAVSILQSLPLVASEELASSPERFVSDEATDINSYWTTTGGSGRNPTSIRLCNSSYGVEWKHMHEIWNSRNRITGSNKVSEGYNRSRDLKLTFRGYHFPEGQIVRYDPIYNELSVDPFQLNNDNFDAFLRKIRRYKIGCMHGYPSLVSLFMERLRARGAEFSLRLILLGSEGASFELKRSLADFFDAKVISWYGQTEKVVLAYDADASGQFVNFSSYGYPWILNPDANGIGEIVGTTFVNKAMPLVNFRTGDYGMITKQRCRDAEGIEREILVINQLQGRTGKDFIFGRNGEKFTMTAVNLHGEIQKKIVFYQIIQNKVGEVEVKVLPKSGFAEDVICRELSHELHKRLKGFDLKCRAVKTDNEFVRSARGKMIMLVQNVKE